MSAHRHAYARVLCLIGAFVLAGAMVAETPAAAAPSLPRVAPAPARPVAPAVAPAAPARPAAPTGCGGPLAFGKIVACPSITGDRRDAYTVTTTKDNDKLFTMLTRGSGDWSGGEVTGSDGAHVCFITVDAGTCQLKAAGRYTVTVSLSTGGSGNYTLSAQSMRTPSTCTTLPNQFFSFASTGEPGRLPAGSAGNCYRFNQPVGSVVRLWSPMANGDVQGTILDGQFQPVCQVRYAQFCTFSTAGPYHLDLFEAYGTATPYRLRMSRITRAAGCAPLRLASFGDPGRYASTGSLGGQDTIACHKLHMPSPGTVGIRIFNSQLISWYVYDDAGRAVCDGYNLRSCHLPAAGDYAVITLNRDWNPITYQIAAPALFRNAGCAGGTDLSWAKAAILVHQTSPVQTNCQPFHGTAGDRVIVYRASTNYNFVTTWLVDSTGEPLCTGFSDEDGCVLPATGTYRALSYLTSWTAGTSDATYKLQVRRLSQPVGCPVVAPGTYNAAPAGAAGPIRCRILDIAKPGAYIARAYDAENNWTNASVYDRTGHRICDDSGYCQIPAAGRYTMVLNGGAINSVIDNDFSYVTTLLPYQPSGCPAVSDTGYRDAPYRGGFTAPGEYACLQLATPTGARIAELLPTDATGSAYPSGYVLDSTGTFVCDSSWSLRQSTCELTGAAPYYVVLNENGGNAPGAFSVAFARVDGSPACPVLSRDPNGATVPTGSDHFAVCFSIPADQHASAETFTWHRTSGTGGGTLSVFSGTGSRYCGPVGPDADRTVTCTLPDGPATVILETGAVDAAYQITHKDAAAP